MQRRSGNVARKSAAILACPPGPGSAVKAVVLHARVRRVRRGWHVLLQDPHEKDRGLIGCRSIPLVQ